MNAPHARIPRHTSNFSVRTIKTAGPPGGWAARRLKGCEIGEMK
jgi:hypothetical protein